VSDNAFGGGGGGVLAISTFRAPVFLLSHVAAAFRYLLPILKISSSH